MLTLFLLFSLSTNLYLAKKSKKGSSFLHKLFNLYFWLVHQRCNKTELNLLHTILIFIFDHFSPPEMILVSWRYGTRAGSQKMLQFVLKILSYTARDHVSTGATLCTRAANEPSAKISISEKVPTFLTLLRHYAKQALTHGKWM